MKSNSRFLWLATLVGFPCLVGAANTESKAAEDMIVNVALTPGNLLSGQLVDRGGTAKSGMTVTVSSHQRLIDRAVTDDEGAFVLRMQKGGLYILRSNKSAVLVRAWTNRVAPPSAINRILMVSGEDTIRAMRPRKRRMEAIILVTAGAIPIIQYVGRDAS